MSQPGRSEREFTLKIELYLCVNTAAVRAGLCDSYVCTSVGCVSATLRALCNLQASCILYIRSCVFEVRSC